MDTADRGHGPGVPPGGLPGYGQGCAAIDEVVRLLADPTVPGSNIGSMNVAHTFDGLVEMQKAADEAHGRVLELRDAYGRPTVTPWPPEQTETYEEAWQHWRKLAGEVQAAVTAHAKGEDKPRFEIEVAVRTTARHPEAATA